MFRFIRAWALATTTIIGWGAIFYVLAYIVSDATLSALFLESDLKGSELADTLTDLKDYLTRVVVLAGLCSELAVVVWFVSIFFLRVDLPGMARQYWWVWLAIGLVFAGTDGGARVLDYNLVFRFRPLRDGVGLPLTVLSAALTWVFYWLATALWTPSLNATAVPLGNFLVFRKLRRLLRN